MIQKHDDAEVHQTAREAAVEDTSAKPTGGEQPIGRHVVLRYTSMRIAIFLIVLLILWLVHIKGVLLVALALVISGIASYALLHGQRSVMSQQLYAAQQRRRSRAAQRAAREDAVADELAEQESPRPDADPAGSAEPAPGERRPPTSGETSAS